MNRGKRGLPAWQARWVVLHDTLHLLEVLLEAISPSSDYVSRYWQLSTDVIAYNQDLQEAYEQELLDGGSSPHDAAYQALQRRLRGLQARAQELTLENEVG